MIPVKNREDENKRKERREGGGREKKENTWCITEVVMIK